MGRQLCDQGGGGHKAGEISWSQSRQSLGGLTRAFGVCPHNGECQPRVLSRGRVQIGFAI